VSSSESEDRVTEPDFPWSAAVAADTMPMLADLDIDVATLPKQVSPPDHWQVRSACYGLDPEIFFPTTEEEAGLALSYCGVCPVKEMCLAWALQNGERYGVWGGTTEQTRRRLIRQVA
jgi:WhiB family transcriptional regulator, redox-sensing transcriptional regulator